MQIIEPEQIYRLPEVRQRIGGLSKSWIYAAVAAATFPAPIRLSSNAIGWRGRDIQAFLDSRPHGIGIGVGVRRS
jgi:predicted DNA-binding transcriptional regulator AlpA